MRLFLKKLSVFAIFIVFLISFLQVWLSIRISGKTIRGHDNLEQTAGINADLVFLGSSRCWQQFDPSFFDSAFRLRSVNIGVDGHTEIAMAIVRLNDYLARNKAPRFAILSFDPFSSGGNPENNLNFVHKNDFARYAFLPSEKNLGIVDYFKFNYCERYIPLYALFRYQLLSDCIFRNNIDNYTIYGYERHEEAWDTVAKPITAVMNKNYFRVSQINEISNSLNDLNILCQAKGIKLICIQTPVYRVIQDDSLFLKTKLICSEIKIPFIDANYKSIRDQINFFCNSNHLNTRGVAAMNSFLRRDTMLNRILRR